MLAVVTGVAGFIGSHLAEALIEDGHEVRGVDVFTTYYAAERKRANLTRLLRSDRFSLIEADLRWEPLQPIVCDADVVFHQAAQPGVRLSWSNGFSDYVTHNVLATQRLLDACVVHHVGRVVYASSSSVYGNAPRFPTDEDDLPRPHSPYGVTKLAAEHLCNLYAANWELRTIALRYFTVFGPRQRPDMAMHRLIASTVQGDVFPLFGDGSQVREFTFVDDVIRANLLAAAAEVPAGSVMNVGAGASATVAEVIDLVATLSGRQPRIERLPDQAGDVQRTGGAIDRARDQLGWQPTVGLEQGLRAQIEWHSREIVGVS